MDSQEEILVDGNSAPTVRNQNITERYRRLIPYMTFYLPGTNVLKLPINQAYNFMPPVSFGNFSFLLFIYVLKFCCFVFYVGSCYNVSYATSANTSISYIPNATKNKAINNCTSS